MAHLYLAVGRLADGSTTSEPCGSNLLRTARMCAEAHVNSGAWIGRQPAPGRLVHQHN